MIFRKKIRNLKRVFLDDNYRETFSLQIQEKDDETAELMKIKI
jgi:hypothetical protein